MSNRAKAKLTDAEIERLCDRYRQIHSIMCSARAPKEFSAEENRLAQEENEVVAKVGVARLNQELYS